jgi:hypothetical protein
MRVPKSHAHSKTNIEHTHEHFCLRGQLAATQYRLTGLRAPSCYAMKRAREKNAPLFPAHTKYARVCVYEIHLSGPRIFFVTHGDSKMFVIHGQEFTGSLFHPCLTSVNFNFSINVFMVTFLKIKKNMELNSFQRYLN